MSILTYQTINLRIIFKTYFANAKIPGGLDAEHLRVKAMNYELQGKAYSSVKKALAAAKRKAWKGDRVVVGGSVFTVAEVI